MADSNENIVEESTGPPKETEPLVDALSVIKEVYDNQKVTIFKLQNQVRVLSEQNSKLVRSAETRKEDCEYYQKQVEASQLQKEEYTVTSKALLEQIQVLRKELDTRVQAEAQRSEQDGESSMLQEENQLLENELKQQQDNVQALLKQQEVHENTMRSLTEKIAETEKAKQQAETSSKELFSKAEELKKQILSERKTLQTQIKTIQEREVRTNANLKKQEEQNLSLRKWMKNMERENNELKLQAVTLQKQRANSLSQAEADGSEASPTAPTTRALAIGSNDIVVPEQTYKDTRINKSLVQLCEKLDRTLISMVSASIGPECENQLLITCIPNHKEIDIDIRHALDSAKLGLLRPVVLVFHHLAQHRCKVPVASSKRIMDANINKRSRGLIDIVYWNNHIYDCEANTAALAELQALITPQQEE